MQRLADILLKYREADGCGKGNLSALEYDNSQGCEKFLHVNNRNYERIINMSFVNKESCGDDM